MAEIVGSSLLSAFFGVLFERLATQEDLNFLRPKKAINKLLRELRVLLWSPDGLLDPRVESWHNRLKDVYKASALADKIESEALRRKLEGRQSASNIAKMFMKLCSNPLEEILSSLEHLVSQKDALGLEPAGRSNFSDLKTKVSERFRPIPVTDESGFCGREDIKETIIQSLRSDNVCDEKIAAVPIIGAGGIGKTTLAQIVYNHIDVKLKFGELRAWVTGSTERGIIGQVSNSSQIDGDLNYQVLPFKLNDALKGKKFLLVLEGVWSEDGDEWNNLKSCKSGERGSKIIVTTRSTKVASIAAPNQPHHFLPKLSGEDCWRLFAKRVFTSDQDPDAHPDLQEIGKFLLSVISVGGILCWWSRSREMRKHIK